MEDYQIALIAGLPSFALGYLAYRRSLKVDKVAAQVSVGSESRAGTAQIIEGFNTLVDNVQEDNTNLRNEVSRLLERLTFCSNELELVKKELERLHRKYGENGS